MRRSLWLLRLLGFARELEISSVLLRHQELNIGSHGAVRILLRGCTKILENGDKAGLTIARDVLFNALNAIT
jgi:hypothetical protein